MIRANKKKNDEEKKSGSNDQCPNVQIVFLYCFVPNGLIFVEFLSLSISLKMILVVIKFEQILERKKFPDCQGEKK